jgi:hypothetical protein
LQQVPPLSGPIEHALPQAPQFLRSVAVLMQAPLQRVCPAGQAGGVAQTLLMHDCPTWQQTLLQQMPLGLPPGPAGQTAPQAPQFLGSVVVLTQAPLHRVCPLGQAGGVPQRLLMHDCPTWQQAPLQQRPPGLPLGPVGQMVPQAPQLPGSLLVLTQVPLQSV